MNAAPKSFLLTLFALVGLFFSVALSAPVADVKRDIFTPPVLYPHAGTHWYTGQTQKVTWDTSNAPPTVTDRYHGLITLRFDNFSTPVILAQNFDLLSGSVEVTVPWVLSGDTYQLVLFGDSGNFSPYFSIN